MTLFRKVFQNQSRPAGADEALDEDELRAAFLEMEAQNDLLSLEPFECVAGDDASVDPSPEDDENSESGEVEPLKTVADVLPDEFKLHDRASQGADTEEEPLEEDAYAANETDIGAAVQSDEEIAACLDRALAASPVATSGGEKTIADNHVDDFYANTAGAVVAEPQEDARELDLEDDMAKRPVAVEADGKAFSIEQLEPATEVNVTLTRGDADHARANQSAAVALSAVPAPAAGRAGRRAGRVKTRLLGFNRTEEEADPFGRTPDATATAQREKFPVGWLVIVEGPGVGHSFSIFTGASMIGRGEDQVIRLDFGDNSISRHNHAAIAYDEEDNKFYIGHGGKSNIIRRNARPVLTTEELHHADLIRIGETTLRFVALCGSDFRWSGVERPDATGA